MLVQRIDPQIEFLICDDQGWGNDEAQPLSFLPVRVWLEKTQLAAVTPDTDSRDSFVVLCAQIFR
jgi:hypothetical protein